MARESRSLQETDSALDGWLMGADGSKLPPGTRLSEIAPVQPHGGARTDRVIVYVNGVDTTASSHRESLQKIADQTGARVIGVYNATEGRERDLVQCVGDKTHLSGNRAAATLTRLVRDSVKEGRPLNLMSHSQGSLITSYALRDARWTLHREEGYRYADIDRQMNQTIYAQTMGGAAWTYPDGPKYRHIVNSNDVVPTLAGQGVSLFAKHPSGEVVTFTAGAKAAHFFPSVEAHDLHKYYLEGKGLEKLDVKGLLSPQSRPPLPPPPHDSRGLGAEKARIRLNRSHESTSPTAQPAVPGSAGKQPYRPGEAFVDQIGKRVQEDVKQVGDHLNVARKAGEEIAQAKLNTENVGKFFEAAGKRAKDLPGQIVGEAKKQWELGIQGVQETIEKGRKVLDPKVAPEVKERLVADSVYDAAKDKAVGLANAKLKGAGAHAARSISEHLRIERGIRDAADAHRHRGVHTEKHGPMEVKYFPGSEVCRVEIRYNEKLVMKGRLVGEYEYGKPGPLAGKGPDQHGKLPQQGGAGADGTFAGYRYLEVQVDKHAPLYRMGTDKEVVQGQTRAQWFNLDKPGSALQGRGAGAVRGTWPDHRNPSDHLPSNQKTHAYRVKLAPGSVVCVGEASYMGQGYEGGRLQVHSPKDLNDPHRVVGQVRKLPDVVRDQRHVAQEGKNLEWQVKRSEQQQRQHENDKAVEFAGEKVRKGLEDQNTKAYREDLENKAHPSTNGHANQDRPASVAGKPTQPSPTAGADGSGVDHHDRADRRALHLPVPQELPRQHKAQERAGASESERSHADAARHHRIRRERKEDDDRGHESVKEAGERAPVVEDQRSHSERRDSEPKEPTRKGEEQRAGERKADEHKSNVRKTDERHAEGPEAEKPGEAPKAHGEVAPRGELARSDDGSKGPRRSGEKQPTGERNRQASARRSDPEGEDRDPAARREEPPGERPSYYQGRAEMSEEEREAKGPERGREPEGTDSPAPRASADIGAGPSSGQEQEERRDADDEPRPSGRDAARTSDERASTASGKEPDRKHEGNERRSDGRPESHRSDRQDDRGDSPRSGRPDAGERKRQRDAERIDVRRDEEAPNRQDRPRKVGCRDSHAPHRQEPGKSNDRNRREDRGEER